MKWRLIIAMFFYSCVSFGLLAAALVPMTILVNSTPDHIPADEIAEQQRYDEKVAGVAVREDDA